MRIRFQKHRIVTALLLTTLAFVVIEGVLIYCYLGSWLILPLI